MMKFAFLIGVLLLASSVSGIAFYYKLEKLATRCFSEVIDNGELVMMRIDSFPANGNLFITVWGPREEGQSATGSIG